MKKLHKVRKILYVGNANKYLWSYQNIYKALEKFSDNFICFEYRLLNLQYGKDIMNKMLLDIIEDEKPDFIFFTINKDEFYPETLLKIREISPESISMVFFGDDDTQFNILSRYYALFFDYYFVVQKQCLHLYKKEGLNNFFFGTAINTDNFNQLKTEKKYDVTFIGAPKSTRYPFIKYLIENGIDVKIFGREWHDYPDIKKYWQGSLTNEEMVKVINETRINLCFSKNEFNEPHFKGRPFEIGACNSFMLVEYYSWYLDLFKANKEIVMFKDKEELLKKVRYYLEHEKEREEIASNAYKIIREKYNIFSEMNSFLKKVIGKKITHRPLPILNKKMAELKREDMDLSEGELKKKLKNFHYICFNDGIIKKDPYKEYIQMYSLEKSKKPISCCYYYLHNKHLGNYLYLQSSPILKIYPEHFHKLVNINQLAATKEYFLNNLKLFKDVFNGKKIDFIKDQNTEMIEIPLIEISHIGKYSDFKSIKPFFLPKFLFKLYSLRYQKRLFRDPYIYWLLLEILKGNTYFLWLTLDLLRDKQIRDKLNELKN